MRIVAGSTSQLVAAGNLACTVQERLILTACASATRLCARLYEVHCVVREIIPRTKLCKRSAGAIDSNIAFKMTLEAGAISAGWSQFGRVHDRAASLLRQMLRRIAMTSYCILFHPVGMVVHRTCFELRGVPSVPPSHGSGDSWNRQAKPPASFSLRYSLEPCPIGVLAVVVDGSLKPLTTFLIQVSPPTMSRANKVDELFLSVQGDLLVRRLWRSISVVGHPGLAIPQKYVIADAGSSMQEAPLKETVYSGSAAPCHRGTLILFIDLLMATDTDRIGVWTSSQPGRRH